MTDDNDIMQIAKRVDDLVRDPKVMKRFAEQIKEYGLQLQAHDKSLADESEKLKLNCEKIRTCKRLRNKEKGPPEEGWEWLELLDPNFDEEQDGDEDTMTDILAGWFPPSEVTIPDHPWPWKSGNDGDLKLESMLPAEYLLLACLHDCELYGTRPPIITTELANNCQGVAVYRTYSHKPVAKTIVRDHQQYLTACLADVECDLKKCETLISESPPEEDGGSGEPSQSESVKESSTEIRRIKLVSVPWQTHQEDAKERIGSYLAQNKLVNPNKLQRLTVSAKHMFRTAVSIYETIRTLAESLYCEIPDDFHRDNGLLSNELQNRQETFDWSFLMDVAILREYQKSVARLLDKPNDLGTTREGILAEWPQSPGVTCLNVAGISMLNAILRFSSQTNGMLTLSMLDYEKEQASHPDTGVCFNHRVVMNLLASLEDQLAKRLPESDWPRWKLFQERDKLLSILDLECQEAQKSCQGRPANAVATSTAVAGTPSGVDKERKPESPRHSPDFRSVDWFGTKYEFTGSQAAVVEILWKAWKNGTPSVGDHYILQKISSECKYLKDLFRRNPAYMNMIRPSKTRGSHRLVKPDGK